MKKMICAGLLFLSTAWQAEGRECSPGPLRPCEWSASVRGGVEWMWYPDRRRTDYENDVSVFKTTSTATYDPTPDFSDATVNTATAATEQVDTKRVPSFSDQFDLPWTVVGEISYAVSCNTEFFGDFHYGKANGKSRDYRIEYDQFGISENPDIKPAESYFIDEHYSDLKYFGGTIGARHYFCQICNCAFPFFGVKAGMRHFDPVRAKIHVSRNGVPFDEKHVSYYDSYNVVHGGFQLGLNFECNNCLQFFVMTEILGSCGLKPHQKGPKYTSSSETDSINISATSDTTPVTQTQEGYNTTFTVPARRTMNILSIPITAGVKLMF